MVEQRGVKPKDLQERSRGDALQERRAKDGDLRPQSVVQKVEVVERRRVQPACSGIEAKAKRTDDSQVAELLRRVEQMEAVANRERSEKEALRQDNQRLQRQVNELMLAASASDVTNGDRQTVRSSTAPSSPESPCNGASARSDRQSVAEAPTAPRPPKSLSLQFVEQGTIGQLVKTTGPDLPQDECRSSSNGVPAVASAHALPAEATNGHTLAATTTRSGSAVLPSSGASPRSPRDSSQPGPRISASGRRHIQVQSGEAIRRTWPPVGGITAAPLGLGSVASAAAIGLGIAAAPSAGPGLSPSVSSPGIRSAAPFAPRPAGSPGAGVVCAMTPQPRR